MSKLINVLLLILLPLAWGLGAEAIFHALRARRQRGADESPTE